MGNLLVPVCHVLSGNSYVNTALFARFLRLGFVIEENYRRYVSTSSMDHSLPRTCICVSLPSPIKFLSVYTILSFATREKLMCYIVSSINVNTCLR